MTRATRRTALLVGALVAVAFVLRALAIHQSLYGDELFTHDDVAGRSLGSMLARVDQVENTPPLFFAIVWISAKIGGAAGFGLRLPSLLAGTATVPLVYAVGRRVLGRDAALLGAALFAVSPFAVFYGSEARAFGLMAFLLVLSTYALVRALEPGAAGRWWIAFTVASAAALYTHYTAAPVVAAEICWALAFHPRARRAVALAAAGAALAFVPWLVLAPALTLSAFGALYPFTIEDTARSIAQLAVGHPFAELRDLPGTAGLVLLALAALALAAGLLLDRRRRRPSPGAWLVVAATLATPLAVAAYSAVRTSVFAPRNLYGSLPFGCLLAAALLTRAGRLREVAAAAAVAGLLVTTVRAQQADHQRPPFNQAAAELNHRPGRVVVLNLFPFGASFGRQVLRDSLGTYLRDPPRATQVDRLDRQAYRRAAVGPRLNIVVEQLTGLPGDPPRPARPPGYRFVRREVFPGFSRIALFTLVRAPSPRPRRAAALHRRGSA